MVQYKQSIPRKVEFARNALISLVHDRALQPGDRLPSYAALRDALGIGSQTIADAVDLLCRAGILEVRDKVGIFVQNPNGSSLAGRTVAVVVRQLEGSIKYIYSYFYLRKTQFLSHLIMDESYSQYNQLH